MLENRDMNQSILSHGFEFLSENFGVVAFVNLSGYAGDKKKLFIL